MIRHLLTWIAVGSTALAGHPCNVNSVFLQSSIPGYVLYQAPQVQYAPQAVGASYQQKDHAKVESELAELKAMVRALAEKGLADGTVSAKAFAVISQPMVNKHCVHCHRVASPETGKGFPLTDIASLTFEQRMRIVALVMSENPEEQMPKPASAKATGWNAEDAGKLIREVTSIKAKPGVPAGVE